MDAAASPKAAYLCILAKGPGQNTRTTPA